MTPCLSMLTWVSSCEMALTREQRAEAVEFVAALLARCLYKSQIEAQFRAKFGPYSHRQIANYCTRARALLKERYARPAGEWGADLSEFLASKLRDPDTPPGVQLKAVDLLMDLHGLRDQRPVADLDSRRELVLAELQRRYLAATGQLPAPAAVLDVVHVPRNGA